jgi:hypothetical protein
MPLSAGRFLQVIPATTERIVKHVLGLIFLGEILIVSLVFED